ncbi:MAG: TonB-dependent receptor [Candidatus Omnitrophica bacterium]|nr:TonB-dependent receptor [Candidatus Omnitrophota bacterium]
MSIILNLFIVFIAFSSCFAQEECSLEKIVVRQERGYSDNLSSQEIREFQPDYLTNPLNLVTGLDVRSRAGFGIQGDLSLRGSTYEQVAVAIDGINVMDPQTGHYNLDLPLTIFDLEKIDIKKSGDSSFYGAGALAGSANFITKKVVKKELNLNTEFGENALFGQTFSFSLPSDTISSRVSFDHVVSKAARPNTDFEYKTASFYLERDFKTARLDTLFGYQKKDYGAANFYSNLFPEEEEHTETIFVKTGYNQDFGLGELNNNVFLKKHRDKFILQRNNPQSVNYHTTYVYGMHSDYALPIKFGEFSVGAGLGEDQINSSNLGKHSRLHESFNIGANVFPKGRLSGEARLRMDYYQDWSWQESFNFNSSYDLIGNFLKLKAAFSRAFRIPTFTELYYSDAANKGNSDLKIERSDNFTLGVDSSYKQVSLGIEAFLRRGFNLIDWTRKTNQVPWQAKNLGRIDYKGLTFNSILYANWDNRAFKIKELKFSYNYNYADKKEEGLLSKYALDILKHQFLCGIDTQVLGLTVNWQLAYNQRYFGPSYFLGNFYMSKKFYNKSLSIEPFVKIDNFTDVKYCEVQDVLMPGRWIKSGLKFEW